MSQYLVSEGQSIIDLAVRQYGSVEAVFDVMAGNGFDLNAELQAGQIVSIADGVRPPVKMGRPPKMPAAGSSVVAVSNGQNLIDLSLAGYGDVESVFELMRLNNLGINDPVAAGDALRVDRSRPAAAELVNYFSRTRYRINTGEADTIVYLVDEEGNYIVDENRQRIRG